jgi:hypothetical protein
MIFEITSLEKWASILGGIALLLFGLEKMRKIIIPEFKKDFSAELKNIEIDVPIPGKYNISYYGEISFNQDRRAKLRNTELEIINLNTFKKVQFVPNLLKWFYAEKWIPSPYTSIGDIVFPTKGKYRIAITKLEVSLEKGSFFSLRYHKPGSHNFANVWLMIFSTAIGTLLLADQFLMLELFFSSR